MRNLESAIQNAFTACRNVALDGWDYPTGDHPKWFGTTGAHLGDCAAQINKALKIHLQTDNRYFKFTKDCEVGVARLNDCLAGKGCGSGTAMSLSPLPASSCPN